MLSGAGSHPTGPRNSAGEDRWQTRALLLPTLRRCSETLTFHYETSTFHNPAGKRDAGG
jgi:hypothetical protein